MWHIEPDAEAEFLSQPIPPEESAAGRTPPSGGEGNSTYTSTAQCGKYVSAGSPPAPQTLIGQFTPDCVREFYRVPPLNITEAFAAGTSVGALNFQYNCANYTDLAAGLALIAPDIPAGYLPEHVVLNSPYDPAGPCETPLEPNIDLLALLPLVYPMQVYDLYSELTAWSEVS